MGSWVAAVLKEQDTHTHPHKGSPVYLSQAQPNPPSPAWLSTPTEPTHWDRRWRAMLGDRLPSCILPLGGSLWLQVQPRPGEGPTSCLCYTWSGHLSFLSEQLQPGCMSCRTRSTTQTQLLCCSQVTPPTHHGVKPVNKDRKMIQDLGHSFLLKYRFWIGPLKFTWLR